MRFKQFISSNKIWFYLIIIFFGLMSASVTHAENYTPIAIWGTSGTENGQFNYPSDITIDSLGNVYVTDTNNNRIQKFDSNDGGLTYNYVTKWGEFGSDEGLFWNPSGIAADSLGNIYVTDWNNHRVQKFNSSDGGLTYNFAAKWGEFGENDSQFVDPLSVTVDSLDNVYVADYFGNSRIQKFNRIGEHIFTLNGGNFACPYDIAVDSSDNFYILDDCQSHVLKYDINGEFVMQMGSPGVGKDEIGLARGVAVDSLGNIYVADSGLIKKFDSSGTFIMAWGPSGSDDGQQMGADDIAVDSLDNVYVVDMGGNCIRKFALEKTTPTITWNNPVDLTYGTPLSNTQLNAKSSVPGTFTYTANGTQIDIGTVLNAGTHTLHADFKPIDTAHYNVAYMDVTINVQKATPTISWNTPKDIVQGTPLSSTQLNAVASVPGKYLYTPIAGTVLSAGTYALKVNFKPKDTTNYNKASASVLINIRTPVQKIKQMTATVESLVISGELKRNQGDKLNGNLNAAIKYLNAKKTNKAINELNDFINQIEAYVQHGKLSPTQGQALVDTANSVIYVLKKS
ncbi:MAG: 6-bladed beta-propeller [Euryarchaeota archaeon]|nr:6-bladed beta-propeller [Euryarchaeota archaeon]